MPNSEITYATANATNAGDAASAAAAANAADAASAVTTWKQIRADCKAISSGAGPEALALWHETGNPLADVWAEVKKQLTLSSPARSDETARGPVAVDWSFWIKWYDDALAGTPPNWKILEQIALIAPAEWGEGAEVINPLIAGIVAQLEDNTNGPKDFQPTPVSPAAKTEIVERVQQNREVIALSVAGVLEQIFEFRERIRRINDLDPAYRENIFEFLDELSMQLTKLLGQLPDADQVIDEPQAESLVTWGQKFTHSFFGKAKEYTAPDNVAGAAVPTGIILACTAIGTFFGPAGALAGGVVGRLITGELKPSKAAGALIQDDDPPSDE